MVLIVIGILTGASLAVKEGVISELCVRELVLTLTLPFAIKLLICMLMLIASEGGAATKTATKTAYRSASNYTVTHYTAPSYKEYNMSHSQCSTALRNLSGGL